MRLLFGVLSISRSLAAMTSAMLVRDPLEVTVPLIVNATVWFGAMVPMLHSPLLLLYELPLLELAFVKETPVGRTSCTTTPVAVLGPALVTLIVKVSDSPTLGEALLTDLLNERSIDSGVIVTDS